MLSMKEVGEGGFDWLDYNQTAKVYSAPLGRVSLRIPTDGFSHPQNRA